MSWSYRKHLKANFGINNERLSGCPTRVTRLTFDQWLAFYHGDPEHWIDFENSNFTHNNKMNTYHIPVYKKFVQKYLSSGNTYKQTEYIYIKFLTRADFKKYHDYITTILKNGEDFENLREIEELARYIGKIADQRLRETQKRTQKAIDDNQKLMEETRLKIRAEMSGGEQVELSF